MKLLICAQEAIGPRMAGPAIRARELARVLGATLAAPEGGDVEFHPHDPGPLRAALREHDAVLTPPLWPRHVAAIRKAGIPWICDLYAPEPLETLEHFRDRPRVRRLMSALALDRLDDALAHASLLLCATVRQRDLWTGALLAGRGLPPGAYDANPERFAIVPFGLPSEPPVANGDPLRERFPIPADAPAVVWNGGVWPWLDPQAAVDAVLAQPDAHLVFMGGADVAPSERVHIGDWVPYEERGAWLLAADAAISTHHDQLETRYAFRTRILDALWAGLPVVCTPGDELAELIERDDLGAVGDPARGLERVLAAGKAAYAYRIAQAAAGLTWERVAEPLRAPHLTPPPSRRAPHPARAARTLGYRTARPLLDALGRRDWPQL